jgi:phosphoribosyl-AMP cyclohydrolase
MRQQLIRFNQQGLVPAVIQDAASGRVLTLCYMDREALTRSLKEGKVYVFRRSQNRMMLKGETSGHVQRIKRVWLDCEGQSLLIEVAQRVACCHAGYFSCYYRRRTPQGGLRATEPKVFDPDKVYRSKPSR